MYNNVAGAYTVLHTYTLGSHEALTNRFGIDSNQFGRYVNATKKFQTDLTKTVRWFEIGLEPI